MLRFIVDIIKDLLCQADISIHLMLRFIQMFLLSVQLFQPFQYISCYGLSRRSHLILRYITQFQYISCYGLSSSISPIPENPALFQYISCYGLSQMQLFQEAAEGYFNTSHVTVYPRIHSSDPIRPHYFNTSHVTVYLGVIFIDRKIKGFQYISCYGLS